MWSTAQRHCINGPALPVAELAGPDRTTQRRLSAYLAIPDCLVRRAAHAAALFYAHTDGEGAMRNRVPAETKRSGAVAGSACAALGVVITANLSHRPAVGRDRDTAGVDPLSGVGGLPWRSWIHHVPDVWSPGAMPCWPTGQPGHRRRPRGRRRHPTSVSCPDRADTTLPVLLAGLRSAGVRGLLLVLPVPGDLSGLPGPAGFNHRALDAGQAVLTVGGNPQGLVPSVEPVDPDGPPGHRGALATPSRWRRGSGLPPCPSVGRGRTGKLTRDAA